MNIHINITPMDFIQICTSLIAVCATIIVGIHIYDYLTIRTIIQRIDKVDEVQSELKIKQKEIEYNLQIAKSLAIIYEQPYTSAKIFCSIIQDAVSDENALYCQKGIHGIRIVAKWINKKDRNHHYSMVNRELITLDFLSTLPENNVFKSFRTDIRKAIEELINL